MTATTHQNAPHPWGRSSRISVPQVLLSAALILGALSIVFLFKIGPVVLTLTATHGVHVGDTLAAVPATLAVLTLTRRRGTSRDLPAQSH